jgi:tetratricopeptide (TPR) repeat protein
MLGWTKWAIAIAITSLAMGGAAPAIAGDTTVQVQRLGPPDVEARRESLLKQMLSRPNDLDLAFEYATLSSQVGDYEAAVSTLERMLIYAPKTPRLQLELGILYYKLGSYEVVRAYFVQALANPSVPPSVAAQVRLYLQQLALAADPPAFSASIFLAIRWESNANAGPGRQLNTGGLNFGGDLSIPGVPTGALNKFSGALSATNELPQNLSDLSGNVTGSFVRPLSEGLPSGAIGNWNIGNNNYKATGIFAGGLAPVGN